MGITNQTLQQIAYISVTAVNLEYLKCDLVLIVQNKYCVEIPL